MTGNLKRVPTMADQAALAGALDAIESAYEFSPAGVFVFVSYGLGYFSRLPGGLNGGSVAATHIPRLNFDNNRFVLEEAKPGSSSGSSTSPRSWAGRTCSSRSAATMSRSCRT